jgi:glycosyltransferase involved in cell wall biosynthesis
MDTTTKNLTTLPLVSILMLTYNRAHFLPVAIESVLAQSYAHWELIIIDDGSTDDTQSVFVRYPDPRIRYIRHERNAGLFARRKESIGLATGTYIAVLDSDDYWTDPEKLATQVTFLENNLDCVLVGTQTTVVDVTSTKIGHSNFACTDKVIRTKVMLQNQFTHSSIMMRTTAVQATAGYQPTLAEDLELFLALGTHGTLANLDRFMTAHRVHANSENDHGIKMRSAVRKIITTYRRDYPGYFVAYWYLTVRIAISNILTKVQQLKQ